MMEKENIYKSITIEVDNHYQPLRVRMKSSKYSPVCSVSFGSSFTLNCVDSTELQKFANELFEFASMIQDVKYP